jgi:aminopeptidase N
MVGREADALEQEVHDESLRERRTRTDMERIPPRGDCYDPGMITSARARTGSRQARLLIGALLTVLLVAACAARNPRGASGVRAAPISGSIAPRTAPYDVETYTLSIDIDPVARSIDAACTIRLWPLVETLERVELDLDGLEVVSVMDRAGRSLRFTRESGTLAIELAAPLARGAFEEITVAYRGRPTRGLFFAAERDGMARQVWTHGECRDARAWFPCFDEPSERATSEIRVTMPREWVSIAAGERVDRVERGERATEAWRMASPHPSYLVTLVAGELSVETGAWEDVPLVFAGPPAMRDVLQRAFHETDEMLAFFSRITGKRYPYPKYAQACVDNFPFGGMENVSATTLTETMLPDERALADEVPFGLLAHEVAHQWFGNLLTCRDWTHAWLNEGFATYFAALYTEESRGVEAFRREMRANRAVYLARDTRTKQRPLVHGVAREPFELFFTGHIYQGGAVRLHHLRSVVGDDAFFRGVRAYVAAHENQGVVTDDLRVAMEQACGTDLRWFFDQWMHAPGHPQLKSHWTVDEETGLVELFLEQTQDGVGTPQVFRLPLDVEVCTRGGTRIERVVMDQRRQRFTFPCTAPVEWIRVDPFDVVPMRLDEEMPTRSWIAMAQRASDAGGRLRALHVLDSALARAVSSPDHDSMSLAKQLARVQWAPDASPEARIAQMRLLRRFLSPPLNLDDHARDPGTLMERASLDADPEVRAVGFELLAGCAEGEDLIGFAQAELERVDSWRVRAAIAALIAKADPDHAWDRLTGELEVGSAHGMYEARILATIAATQGERAHDLLIAWARDESKPDEARIAAVRALGRIEGNEVVRKTLCELLDSPRMRVRRETLTALGVLRDGRTRPALEEFRRASRIDLERYAAEDALTRIAAGS